GHARPAVVEALPGPLGRQKDQLVLRDLLAEGRRHRQGESRERRDEAKHCAERAAAEQSRSVHTVSPGPAVRNAGACSSARACRRRYCYTICQISSTPEYFIPLRP